MLTLLKKTTPALKLVSVTILYKKLHQFQPCTLALSVKIWNDRWSQMLSLWFGVSYRLYLCTSIQVASCRAVLKLEKKRGISFMRATKIGCLFNKSFSFSGCTSLNIITIIHQIISMNFACVSSGHPKLLDLFATMVNFKVEIEYNFLYRGHELDC